MAKPKGRFQYPMTMKFNGKAFRFQGSAETKSGATRSKKILQDAGYLIRVVPHYDVYLIYGRKK